MASEGLLLLLATEEGSHLWLLWGAATAGNVLGALVNWWLGLYALHFQGRRWFPFKQKEIDRGHNLFMKYGLASLLLAWLPIVGDPITFVAGVCRVPVWIFLVLVTIGKGARYAALLWFV